MSGQPLDLYVSLLAAAAAEEAVCLKVCVHSHCAEAENDDYYECISDVGQSLFPDLVAPSDGLECAPEAVAEVKSECYEPYDVDNDHP